MMVTDKQQRGLGLPVCLSALLLLLPVFLLGYADGPPPAVTGGFGEADCQECHFGSPLNDPKRTLSLEGIPTSYQPGNIYPLTIRFNPPAASAGFELSVRFTEGARAGVQAGRLSATGDQVKVIQAVSDSETSESSAGHLIQYAVHTETGNHPGQEGWTIHWAAPDSTGGPVAFHVAANAANGDDSPFGDFIYATSLICYPESQRLRVLIHPE